MDTEIVPAEGRPPGLSPLLTHELQHLAAHWLWVLLLGVLLVLVGAAAIIIPQATVGTTLAVTILLGAILMIGGVASIVSSFWIGRWSGFLVQLLVGLIYLACGFVMTEKPVVSALAITIFIAVTFIILGVFRLIGALVLRFPQWGWSVLNGVITLVAGVLIYRQLPFDAFWIIGLLVGLEMLFNGWSWIMLGLVLRRIHTRTGVPVA